MSPDIGEFIKGLRENARISLRQLADQAGVSNPYLSQIERGLRKPSAEVLAQIAGALRVSTPVMYLRAGLLGTEDGPGVLSAIAADPVLTVAQKQSLTQIYETFIRENARHDFADGATGAAAEAGAGADDAGVPVERSAAGKATSRKSIGKPAGGDADLAVASVKSDINVKSSGGEPKAGDKPAGNKVAGSKTAGSKRAGSKRADGTKTANDTKSAHVQEDKS